MCNITKGILLLSSLLMATAVLVLLRAPAMADEMRTYRRLAIVRYHLPPERHVIEGVRWPGSGVFLINGRYFASPACPHWAAGERITLIAGDWHGYCETATFYNFRRRAACTMWC